VNDQNADQAVLAAHLVIVISYADETVLKLRYEGLCSKCKILGHHIYHREPSRAGKTVNIDVFAPILCRIL
jgi:hypothetical protein